MILIVMGVAGSGKTTIGRLLAEELGWPFYEGDEFHPPENVAKMSQGTPLTDEDRMPWLERLRALIQELGERGESSVIACSALRESYRARLQGGDSFVRFIYLKGDYDLISSRIGERRGHYMPAHLLQSQFDALEEPDDAMVLDVLQSPDALVAGIRRQAAL